MLARVDSDNSRMAGLRVCRTHPELYKDPPLWFGTELNWTDINKMPSDIDPMSTFRERSAEHWVWRDFVFLRITTPTDLLLPPPYFLPEVLSPSLPAVRRSLITTFHADRRLHARADDGGRLRGGGARLGPSPREIR